MTEDGNSNKYKYIGAYRSPAHNSPIAKKSKSPIVHQKIKGEIVV
jgi:hypothetical protein